jgi:hypothetical protein
MLASQSRGRGARHAGDVDFAIDIVEGDLNAPRLA